MAKEANDQAELKTIDSDSQTLVKSVKDLELRGLLSDPEDRDRRFSHAVVTHCVCLTDGGVFANRGFDHTANRVNVAMDDGKVSFESLPLLKLASNGPMALIGFCDDHDTRCVFVKTMDNTWPKLTCTDATETVDATVVEPVVLAEATSRFGDRRVRISSIVG